MRKMGDKLRNGRGKARKRSGSRLKEGFKMEVNPLDKQGSKRSLFSKEKKQTGL